MSIMKLAQSDHSLQSERDGEMAQAAAEMVVPPARISTPHLQAKQGPTLAAAPRESPLLAESYSLPPSSRKLRVSRSKPASAALDLEDVQVDLQRHSSLRAVPHDSCESSCQENPADSRLTIYR